MRIMNNGVVEANFNPVVVSAKDLVVGDRTVIMYQDNSLDTESCIVSDLVEIVQSTVAYKRCEGNSVFVLVKYKSSFNSELLTVEYSIDETIAVFRVFPNF